MSEAAKGLKPDISEVGGCQETRQHPAVKMREFFRAGVAPYVGDDFDAELL